MRVRGLRLATDDAGSGWPTSHHLADLIKPDITFVRPIDADPARRAVARALVGFAAEVGASLIAEDIETSAELDQLRALGPPRPGLPPRPLRRPHRAPHPRHRQRLSDE